MPFRRFLERGKGPAPKLIEVPPHVFDPIWVDLIELPGSLRLREDKAGVLQYPQVLRDGWTADRQPARDLGDRARPVGEAFENGSPGGIAQGADCGRSVSHCLR